MDAMTAMNDFVSTVGAGDAPDFSVADGMISIAAGDVHAVSKALGTKVSDPQEARSSLLDAYFGVLSDNVLDMSERMAREKAIGEENSMLESKFRYSGIDDATASRVLFDSSVGDTVAQDRIDKRFYFD